MDKNEPMTSETGSSTVPSFPDGSKSAVDATVEAVRERLPPALEAGGRAMEQVAQRAPQAIDSTITAVDQSSTTLLAAVAGASAGLSIGLLVARVPRVLAIALAGVALVLAGTLLGRRGGDLEPWDP